MAALKQTLCISSSMGRMLVCASMISVTVVRSTPVIAVTTMCWTDVRHLVIPIDPRALVPCILQVTGAYQTSAAYVNLGMATVQ